MNVQEVIDLERNIKMKNKAVLILESFMKKQLLNVSKFKGGRFEIWSDSHNQKYIQVSDNRLTYQCRFLHNTYDIDLTISGVYDAISNKSRGASHLACDAGVKYSEYEFN